MSDKWKGIESDDQRRFLDAYVGQPNPRRAALEAGIDPSKVEGWLSSCPCFIEWCDLIDEERSPAKEFPGLSETQLAFLTAYRTVGKVSHAARIAQVCRSTVYHEWLKKPAFEEAFDRVKHERVEEAIEEAHRRAVKGTLEPVFREDGIVGYKRKFSDRLLVEIMRAERPEKYRSNHKGPSGSVVHRKTIQIADAAIRTQLEQEAGDDDKEV